MFRSRIFESAAAAAARSVAYSDEGVDTAMIHPKLLPRGSMTTWGVHTGGLRVKSGLNLRDAAEPRCGIFTTVSEELVKHGPSVDAKTLGVTAAAHPSSSSAVIVAPLPRLPAWLKGEPGDWQRSTINMHGEVKQMTKRPRPKWSKVAPKKTVPIEVDINTPRDSPTKLYHPYTVHHGLYSRRRGKLPVGAPLLNFTYYGENWHHKAVLTRLGNSQWASKDGGDSGSAAAIADQVQLNEVAADGFGSNSVSGVLLGGTREGLPHSSELQALHPLIFNPETNVELTQENYAAPLKGRGSYNRILLRGVVGTQEQVVERLQRLAENGFINYFSVGSFGAGSNAAHDIAASLFATPPPDAGSSSSSSSDIFFRGRNTEGKRVAMGMWLQSEAQSNPVLHDYYKAYVSAADRTSSDAMLKMMETKLRRDHPTTTDEHLLQFLKKLNTHTQECNEASSMSDGGAIAALANAAVLDDLWTTTLLPEYKTYFQGMGRFIWNAIASQRVMAHGVERVVVGDLVFIATDGNGGRSSQLDSELEAEINPLFSKSQRVGEVRMVETEEEALSYSIFNVVLPLPCARSKGSSDDANLEGDVLPLFPGNKSCDESLYREVAKSSGMAAVWSTTTAGTTTPSSSSSSLAQENFGYNLAVHDTPGVLLSEGAARMPYRYLLAKPESLSFKMEYDPNSLSLLKTDLFLVQERKPLTTDLEGTRFRGPSPLNQSEVLKDSLSEMVQLSCATAKDCQVKLGTSVKTLPSAPNATIGPHCVALSFMLPSGTHPQCLLRECFEAKQIHYADLLRPTGLSS